MTLLQAKLVPSMNSVYHDHDAKLFTGAGTRAVDVHADIILGQDAYGVSDSPARALNLIFSRSVVLEALTL